MKNLITGIIFGLMAQAATFFQLQGPLKWLGWNKYYWVVVCAGIPISMLYIKSEPVSPELTFCNVRYIFSKVLSNTKSV